MTLNHALKLAREAGLYITHSALMGGEVRGEKDAIQRFADLVLEEAAKTLDNLDPINRYSDPTREHCARAIRAMKGARAMKGK